MLVLLNYLLFKSAFPQKGWANSVKNYIFCFRQISRFSDMIQYLLTYTSYSYNVLLLNIYYDQARAQWEFGGFQRTPAPTQNVVPPNS